MPFVLEFIKVERRNASEFGGYYEFNEIFSKRIQWKIVIQNGNAQNHYILIKEPILQIPSGTLFFEILKEKFGFININNYA